MKKNIFKLFFILSFSCFSQVDSLKPEFRNVSWIIDNKTADIVKTLSMHFGVDSLRSNEPLVTESDYNLYYDSLSLWYITKDAYRDNDITAKSTSIGDFNSYDVGMSTYKYITNVLCEYTERAYKANNNSTVGDKELCYPSSYKNMSLFYKEESKYITEYNQGRIRVYTNKLKYNKSIIKFYIVVHKSIMPIDYDAVKLYPYEAVPYFYLYQEPKRKVKAANISNIWESKTGLPYSVAKQLNLSDNRIQKVINLLPRAKNDSKLLIQRTVEIKSKDIEKIKFTSEYSIDVKCDTCLIKMYDNQQEDGDVVTYSYNGLSETVNITNIGSTHSIIIREKSEFYLSAISEGLISTCTINAKIDGGEYEFVLHTGETIIIKLNKL